MKLPRKHGFTLVESLSMMVTLIVFGWLCVAVIRYHFKTDKEDVNKPRFIASETKPSTDTDKKSGSPKPAADVDKPWNKLVPTPSPAPAKP